jgi:hypothetical protein
MGKKLTFLCSQFFLIPTGEDAQAYLTKHSGELVQGEFKQPRSLEQNALLWAVAEQVYQNLPPQWEGKWPDKYRMVKGMQLYLGLTDDVLVPTTRGGGTKLERSPTSIAEMTHDEATAAVDLLLDAMGKLVELTADELKQNAGPMIGVRRTS